MNNLDEYVPVSIALYYHDCNNKRYALNENYSRAIMLAFPS